MRLLILICLLTTNLVAENTEEALENTILKFWEARNSNDFEKIFFYESKIGAITGSSSENHFYVDPPPDFDSVINYYSKVSVCTCEESSTGAGVNTPVCGFN